MKSWLHLQISLLMLILGAAALLAATTPKQKKCYCNLKESDVVDMYTAKIKSAEVCCKDIDSKRKLVDNGKYCPVKESDGQKNEREVFNACCQKKYAGQLEYEFDEDKNLLANCL